MRVAFISFCFPPSHQGGVPLYMESLVNQLSLRSEIEEIKVFTAGNKPDEPTEKIEVIPVEFSKKLPPTHAFGKAAYREMKSTYDSPPDLVHSTIGHGRSALDYNVPMVTTFFDVLPRFRSMLKHYNYSFPRRIKEHMLLRAREHFEKKICKKVHHIVTVSESIKQDIGRYYGIHPDKISTILGTGIDTQRFKPSLDSEKIRGTLPPSEHVVLTVTNFEPIKGVHLLVRAMKDVLTEFPHTHFLFVGEGTQRMELERMIRALQLEKNATFTGQIDQGDLPLYYSAADVFVRPSLWEGGTGFAFMESLACGTPVIGTNVGGIPEVVPPSCGLLVPPGDSKSLANAINNLLGDDNLRKKMAGAGPSHVKQNFTWDIITDKYLKIYNDLLKTRLNSSTSS